MFVKLKDGRKLNLYWLSDCFVGKHDKKIVIFYMVNNTKLIEAYDTDTDAAKRVSEVEKIMANLGQGGSGGESSDCENCCELEWDITSNKDCGAAPAKTFFKKGLTFTEFAEKVLRTDIAPSFNVSFTNIGIYECGRTIPSTLMKLNVTNKPDVTYTIDKSNFYLDTSLVGTDTGDKAAFQYNYTTPIKSDVPKVFTPKAEIVYNTNKKGSKTNGTFQFVYPSYYGVINIGMNDINDTKLNNIVSQWTIVENVTNNPKTTADGVFNKRISASKAFDYTGVTLNDQRFFYMYPASYGALTNILDGNGFKYTDSYTSKTISIITTNGQTVPYLVYLLTDPTTNTGLIQKYS